MFRLLLIVLCSVFVWGGQGGFVQAQENDVSPEAAVNVAVSILPQKWFVEQIGGDRVSVQVLVRPGESPHTYSPTARQMAALSHTDLLFTIGVPFEETLMPRLESNFPALRIVPAHAGIERREMEEGRHHEEEEEHDHDVHEGEEGHDHDGDHHHDGEAEEHSHGGHDRGEGEEYGHDHEGHHHEGEDPHVWLDPVLAKTIAANIAESLIEADPEGATIYREGLALVQTKLDDLHARLTQALASLKGETLFVYHPAYGYFAERYGLHQMAVEVGGKEPSPKAVGRFISQAKEAGVRVVFVQLQFSKTAANTIAKAIGGVVVGLDPLAEDYVANLEEIAGKIQEALTP